MVTLLTLLAPVLMLHAEGLVHAGRDEFGRRCLLTLAPKLAVMIEDEWFADARDEVFRQAIGGRGRTGRTFATLRARGDGTDGELDLALTNGRATSFTLTLTAASYYVHSCRLDD